MENNKKEEKHFIADIPLKALIENKGRVLLVRDDNGMWELPGGRMNEGEVIEEALRRELIEELGLEINVVDIFDAFYFTGVSGQNHFVVIYQCEVKNLDDMKIGDGEVKEIKWVGAGEFESLPMRQQYKDTLGKYFKQRVPSMK